MSWRLLLFYQILIEIDKFVQMVGGDCLGQSSKIFWKKRFCKSHHFLVDPCSQTWVLKGSAMGRLPLSILGNILSSVAPETSQEALDLCMARLQPALCGDHSALTHSPLSAQANSGWPCCGKAINIALKSASPLMPFNIQLLWVLKGINVEDVEF